MCAYSNEDNKNNKNNKNKNNNNGSSSSKKKHAVGGPSANKHEDIKPGKNPKSMSMSMQTSTSASTSALALALPFGVRKSGSKWKIIISTIILLLCRTSLVMAMRKGRLMSPSSFTALSGDLHVQIQFSGEDVPLPPLAAAGGADGAAAGSPPGSTTTTRTTTSSSTTTTSTIRTTTGTTIVGAVGGEGGRSRAKEHPALENIITSTLVISKYLDDVVANGSVSAGRATNASGDSREPLLQRKRKEIVQNIPLFPDPRHNVTQIAVPCQTFTSGGLYEMQVVTNLKTIGVGVGVAGSGGPPPTMTTTTLVPAADERLRQTLDVRWPSADMRVSPVRLRTYPEQPVAVELRFPEVNCERAWRRAEDLPEFWLELVYCGRERTCAQLPAQNATKASILYAEQVRGYPKLKKVQLGCDLFGLAGNYAVQLRPLVAAPNVPITRRYLSVDWSDKYVFNVYARSIFPCDPHTGIGVLYEYPACILEQGDRVRVYAKLRADVASLKPPTSLHYVAEQRVVKSQYSLYFSCDLFTEKYVEYCFVYVSQAISGAVADVRMDCVPTLPVSDSDTGGWGPWSEWTPCSTNCLGGTRNRYRFCDSPPPRYGAKFCEGDSVETEKCGKTISDTWDCIYETSGSAFSRTNRTEVSQEIGPGCRCGCIVHLGSSKPKRIIAGATQSCPGRSFWLIQVDGEENIALSLSFMRLPCASQYIKVRDGPSLSSTLLIELKGGGDGSNAHAPLIAQLESAGAQLLVEFFAGDDVANLLTANSSADGAAGASSSCTGGFLANVEQIARNMTTTTSTLLAATRLSVKSRAVLQKPQLRARFTLVHLSAVVFASIIILISAMLGAQYVLRYRKYHLAVTRRRDEGSRLHTPRASLTSLQSPPSRAISTTTLLSEVIYMVKMRPKHQLRHSILRESVDAEHLARDTEFGDSDASHTPMVKCVEELGSNGSIVTLRNELVSPTTVSISRSPSTDGELDGTEGEVGASCSRNGTLTRKDSAKDSESIISSGMSSICNSPPMRLHRLSKYSDRYDAITLKIRNSRFDDSTGDSIRSISLRDYERVSQSGSRGSASLTNGCYSPAASVVSTATIRTTNAKESKEKQNRKRLLARPGSEFSLGNQEELELDYYDYNVINAGAAPGSYLGMDPAHLIWIPPFDDVDDDDDDKTPEPAAEPDETEPLYEEIKMPRYGHYLSPGSNTESSTNNTTTPTSDELSPLNSGHPSKATSPSEAKNLRNSLVQQSLAASTSASTVASRACGSKQPTPYATRKQRRHPANKSSLSLGTGTAGSGERRETELIAMRELSGTKSARNIAVRSLEAEPTAPSVAPPSPTPSDAMTGSYVEKETSVVKSPSDLQDFLALDDIQFADESESDHDAVTYKEAAVRKDNTLSTLKRDIKRVYTGAGEGAVAAAKKRLSTRCQLPI